MIDAGGVGSGMFVVGRGVVVVGGVVVVRGLGRGGGPVIGFTSSGFGVGRAV